MFCGISSGVERLLSKQVVTGSNPVSRSTILNLKLIYSLFGSLDIITDGKNLVRISRADVIEMT